MRDVLIVDDEPQMVELISRMLQSAQEAYHPIKAYGGEEALARLRREPIDLVLLDIIMPGVGGLAVLQEMKMDPSLARIPVIVISAQYPETARHTGGLFLNLVRPESPSVSETLNLLQAVVGALPVRGLPAPGTGPGSPATPAGQRVSSGRRRPRGKEPVPAL